MALINDVWQDVEKFLCGNKKVFFNERDLQLNLAAYLICSKKYANVRLEYFVPSLGIKLDIVVEGKEQDADCFIPIELKYRTKKFAKNCPISLLGTKSSINSIIKDQSAQDLGRYGFWKDVHRLEQIKKGPENHVSNGIVLFLTNDSNYITCPKSPTAHYNYEQFSMTEGTKLHFTRNWIKPANKLYPNFSVANPYTIKWNNVLYYSEKFYYCMLLV